MYAIKTFCKILFDCTYMQICCILLRKQLNKYKNLYRNIFAEYKQSQEDTSPAKVDVTSKSPVGDISVVTLIKINTTLDHSQKGREFQRHLPDLWVKSRIWIHPYFTRVEAPSAKNMFYWQK